MTPSRMTPSKAILASLAAIVVAAALWAKFGPSSPRGAPQRDDATDAAARTEPFVDLTDNQLNAIKVGPIESREFEIIKSAVGTIDFDENMLVQVFSQYPGKIIKAFSNIGDDVKKGDILFTIDSPDLLQAESNLLASAGVLELQNRTLARVSGLITAGGSAQRDVDQSKSDQQTAEGNFRAAQNAVRIFGKTDAEIAQVLADRKIDSTLVVPSPISGRIITRSAAPGFLTQPGASPPPYTLADISTMWMIANVIETDAPAYRLGQEVEVTVPAYPDRVFKGHVTNLGSTIDPNSHRQLVRSEIDDPEHLLRSGMFASFRIRIGGPMRSLAVPAAGITREGDGTMTAWVTTDRRRFAKRTVKVGLQQNGWDQILEGLQPNDLVVTDGAVFLGNKLLMGVEG